MRLNRYIIKIYHWINDNIFTQKRFRVLSKIFYTFYKLILPHQFERRIKRSTQKLINQVDRFLCYGDTVPFQPSDDIYSCSEQQGNARQDVINTIESMRHAFRAQGFPIYEGCIDENGNYEYQIAWSGGIEVEPKKPLMDRKYPHVCFECKQPIQYKHAFNEACSKYDIKSHIIHLTSKIEVTIEYREYIWSKSMETYTFEKQFRKIWKSKYVKFLCCSCYRKATQPKKTKTERIWERFNHVAVSGGIVREGTEFYIGEDNENHEEP